MARIWSARWDPAAWGLPSDARVAGVRDPSCRAAQAGDLPRLPAFREARWCRFALDWRGPDGRGGTLPVDRWLLARDERRLARTFRRAATRGEMPAS